MSHVAVAPVPAWCPVNDAGVLMVQHVAFRPNDIKPPPGTGWRIVRVVIDPHDTWKARNEALQAIDSLPDAVACAMLGGQSDPWTEGDAL